MRSLPLVCLLFATLAWCQDTPAPSKVPPDDRPHIPQDSDEQQGLPASASTLAPDTAIITIKGICTPTSSSAANCETVITRAQFEKLTDAVLANMKSSRKRQFAYSYPGLLAMAQEAEARGLDRNPHFQERLAFARLQILSQELVREIGEHAAQISPNDIEDYYRQHAAAFATATLERIFIPIRKNQNASSKGSTTPEKAQVQRKEAEDAMTREAEQLRTKAAAGSDFPTLQKEAYLAAAATDVPPNSSLGDLRLAGLPPNQASVFDLKPGEISQVISDSTGHYIYKVDAKHVQPLNEASEGIRKALEKQRREEAIQSVQRPVTAVFNPDYFGPTEKDKGSEKPNSK
jgi:parvulin-like peptidyl-prolyl cis-trans isomerase-like protein